MGNLLNKLIKASARGKTNEIYRIYKILFKRLYKKN